MNRYDERKPALYWVYVYKNADGTGGYNFETTSRFSEVQAICDSFREDLDGAGQFAWNKCEVLGGDASGTSGDFDTFRGGWTRESE